MSSRPGLPHISSSVIVRNGGAETICSEAIRDVWCGAPKKQGNERDPAFPPSKGWATAHQTQAGGGSCSQMARARPA